MAFMGGIGGNAPDIYSDPSWSSLRVRRIRSGRTHPGHDRCRLGTVSEYQLGTTCQYLRRCSILPHGWKALRHLYVQNVVNDWMTRSTDISLCSRSKMVLHLRLVPWPARFYHWRCRSQCQHHNWRRSVHRSGRGLPTVVLLGCRRISTDEISLFRQLLLLPNDSPELAVVR
jgi:hypothetical protein